MNYSISIYLDTRRAKIDNLYPVKLRVYSNFLNKTILYPVNIDLSKKDFQSIWETQKPRKEHRDQRLQLTSIEQKANDVAKMLKPFSFESFEKKMFRVSGDGENAFYHYEILIKKLNDLEQFGTASNYDVSCKSLKKFIEFKKGNEPKKLLFSEITIEWLTEYETYMLNHLQRSRTTVSMYLRALRTIFNIAIADKEIPSEVYPFGRRKYQIPTSQNTKKALDGSQLKKLHKAKPKNPEQEKAKDFWFFSYNCNGMNIKDIALLRYENLDNDVITFYRAKTLNTTKGNLKTIKVYLNDYTKQIIKKHGNPNKNPKQLIFSIISDDLPAKVNFRRIKNFSIFINDHLRKLAGKNDIITDLSTYWARHSFATKLIRDGKSMEFAGQALGHGDMKTTQNYFAGFEEDTMREAANSLMTF